MDDHYSFIDRHAAQLRAVGYGVAIDYKSFPRRSKGWRRHLRRIKAHQRQI
ncbi:MAG TPA: hypothetical protein VLL76_08665 [Candidatus Omnitrophota bacterium]|nr:hypothetical protein [Candidatus Omnitrophota bacterium]